MVVFIVSAADDLRHLILGNELQIRGQAEVGDLDFAWSREYGATFKISACWGVSHIICPLIHVEKDLNHFFVRV